MTAPSLARSRFRVSGFSGFGSRDGTEELKDGRGCCALMLSACCGCADSFRQLLPWSRGSDVDFSPEVRVGGFCSKVVPAPHMASLFLRFFFLFLFFRFPFKPNLRRVPPFKKKPQIK